MSELSFT